MFVVVVDDVPVKPFGTLKKFVGCCIRPGLNAFVVINVVAVGGAK